MNRRFDFAFMQRAAYARSMIARDLEPILLRDAGFLPAVTLVGQAPIAGSARNESAGG